MLSIKFLSKGFANLASTNVILKPFLDKSSIASWQAPKRAPKFINAIKLPSCKTLPFPISNGKKFSSIFIYDPEPLGNLKDEGLSSIKIEVLIILTNSSVSPAAIIIKFGKHDR